MKADSTHSSVRFFTGPVVAFGFLFFVFVLFYYGKEYQFQDSFILVLGLLLLTGLIILFMVRQTHDFQEEKNRQLAQRTKELDELNLTLESKIQERTESLMTLQTQLLQSEKFSAIGQLAAGVAHEINNPIGFINSNLQTLERYVSQYTILLGIINTLKKALDDKDQQRVLEVMALWENIRQETDFAFMGGDIKELLKESLQGIDKIKKIVSDLRTFASPDRGRMDSVNIETLMESMLNLVSNEIKYKAQLVKDYGQVPLIYCNPQKIGHVFVHLLINAAQSIEGKGTITIKSYLKDEYVCVDIKDTGCGIAAENMTRIFDPFFSTKAPGAGVGLGLSLSYDIVRKHKGVIKFNSKSGEGTTFTVMLPLVAPIYDPSLQWRDYERD